MVRVKHRSCHHTPQEQKGRFLRNHHGKHINNNRNKISNNDNNNNSDARERAIAGRLHRCVPTAARRERRYGEEARQEKPSVTRAVCILKLDIRLDL